MDDCNCNRHIDVVMSSDKDEMFHKVDMISAIESKKGIDVIKDMVKNGVNINHCNNHFRTPLNSALICNRGVDFVKELINLGADVNYRNDWKETPLHFVKDVKCLKLLVDNGADINAYDYLGSTVLMSAIKNISGPAVIEEIINYGANTKKKDKGGRTALMYIVTLYSITNRHILLKLLKSLNYGGEINCKDLRGETVLHKADDSELIKILIDSGANVNAKNNNKETPLMYALRKKKSIEVIKILLDNNSRPSRDLNVTFDFTNDEDIINLLLSYGADFDLSRQYGRTALMNAIQWHKNHSLIKYILDRGGNPNEIDNDCNTPLFYAETEKIVHILIWYGAQVNTNKTIFELNHKCFDIRSLYNGGLAAIVKYILLSHDSERFIQHNSKKCKEYRCAFFDEFVELCRLELDEMKNYNVSITNYNFNTCSEKSFYDIYVKNKNNIIYSDINFFNSYLKCNKIELLDLFPTFYSTVLFNTKILHSRFSLLKYLKRITVIESDECRSIKKNSSDEPFRIFFKVKYKLLKKLSGKRNYRKLDHDSLYLIAKRFLSFRDIYNLLLASMIK